jgi:hypothetical protein
MGVEIAALMGFFGLTSAFAHPRRLDGVADRGEDGPAGLGRIGRDPADAHRRGFDRAAGAAVGVRFHALAARRACGCGARLRRGAGGWTCPARPAPTRALAPPAAALADRRGWKLAGGGVALAIGGSATAYVLTGAPAAQPTELSVPDPSVGRPHARLLIASGRLGLEDLGTASGTFIDGARLLPEHGPRDISAARSIRLGTVELALSRA